jgi:type I restriction enzyme S subunit
LQIGDLVVTKSSGSALHIGKTSVVTEQVAALHPCFSNFMQRLRFNDAFEPRLGAYLLNCPAGRQQLVYNSNTTTGLANLNGSVLGDVVTCVPPQSEQAGIANFLDVEAAKLDRLISKKRELIEKLKEKRTALISRTVTLGLPPEPARAAGLNPNPKLKPSSIEWLGDIPEHWEGS